MQFQELISRVVRTLANRTVWEQRQRLWYKMRHDGLRRINKPYAHAADMHFPLIDTEVEKLKPYYTAIVDNVERKAQFTSMVEGGKAAASSMADYFDYRLTQHSNFDTEIDPLIDQTVLTGRGVIKVRWDPYGKRIEFDSIDQVHLLMPQSALDFDDADFWVHVQHKTVDAYRRERRYSQEPDLIKRIKGGRNHFDESSQYELEVKDREGITYASDEDIIVLWEIWYRTQNGFLVYTTSPAALHQHVRRPFRCPYMWRGKPMHPFVSFPFERKDKGWYAPRGAAEKLAAFEQWLCKNWNAKGDNLDFMVNPAFTSENPIENLQNRRFKPGEYLPGNIKQLQMSGPLQELNQEMIGTRMVAEQRMTMPDLGIANQINTSERKTAREVEEISSIMGQNVDLRGRIFRQSLAELYRKAYAVMLQYEREELVYFMGEDRMVLPEQALHEMYMIEPHGSPNNWSPRLKQQKAALRLRMFTGNPFVNQEELTRDALASDDPRLVRQLFMPANLAQADEAEDEAKEIVVIMHGFKAVAKPGEDHQLRISVVVGKLAEMQMRGEEFNPLTKKRLMLHLAQHYEYLKQQNPQAATQIKQRIKLMEQAYRGEVPGAPAGIETALGGGAPPAEQFLDPGAAAG